MSKYSIIHQSLSNLPSTTDMTNSSKTNLLTEQDPCSASYQGTCIDVTAREVRKSSIPSRKIHRAKLGKKKLGFFRSLKRFLGIKSPRPISFIMTNGSNKRLSQSLRSHSPAKSSNRSSIIMPNPSIYVTSPSTKRRSHYKVHSFEGAGSPPTPTREKSRVRFSHPAVSQEILSTIPSSPSLLPLPESDDENAQNNKRASGASDTSFESPSSRDGSFPSVRPKDLYLYSAQSVTTDGHRESYADFKQRLDGHKRRADRLSSQRPPSLSFIPRTGTIKLDEYDTPQFRSSVKAAEAEKHRSDALSRLEGKTPPKTEDRYVLAILPRADMPSTAVPVSSDAHPSNLIPGSSQTRPTLQRPHTFSGQTFQPYSPSDISKGVSTKRRDKMATMHDEEPVDAHMFDTQDAAGFHSRHSQHYRRVESCEFDEPTKSHSRSLSRPSEQRQSQSQATFLLSPSPPPSKDSDEAVRKAEHRKLVVRKPVLVDIPAANSAKTLLPTPKATSASKSVKPIAMNTNGYPNLFPHPSKRYSATATYAVRTVDSVEAKYMKEHPKEKSRSLKPEDTAFKSHKRSKEYKAGKVSFLDALVFKNLCA